MKRIFLLLSCLFVICGVAAAQTAPPVPQLENVRVTDDWVQVDLIFTQTAELQLQIAGSTCAASVSPALLKAPGRATLSIAAKGFNACLVTLGVTDADGNSTAYRLELGSPGEAGFNITLSGVGNFDPSATPSLSGAGKLAVNGGWGDLHLDGALQATDSGALNGELNLQYSGFQAYLGYGVGPSDHPAGAVGEGLYVSQRIGIFTLAAAAPWGQPMRFGAAIRSPYACGSASINAFLSDPIFGVQVGYQGFGGSAQLRPAGPAGSPVLSFNLEYRAIPDWRFSFGGTENQLSVSGWGFLSSSPLGWVLMNANVGLDLATTGFSSNGSLESENAVLKWASDDIGLTEVSLEGRWYNPLQSALLGPREFHLGVTTTFINLTGHLDLDTSWGNAEPVVFNAGASLNVALDQTTYNPSFAVGARAGITAEALLPSGAFGGKFVVSSTDVTNPDAYTGSLLFTYANTGGWQVKLEVATPITNPAATTVSLTLTSWSYLPVQAPAPTVRFVDESYAPPTANPLPFPCRY